MSTTPELSQSTVYITKINALVTDGREDLIASVVADYEHGNRSPEPVRRTHER
ncbi:MAG: hypothetical protein QOG80_2265 [Pseudonocardiales bacterium]|jgi:hypothetical protein|nr:hypothetical protein [Pseudonocardiales bacterium]